ncbi:MAG: ribose import permease protein RbsC [Bellilinea sp.]|nr:MAG: ribose import permease protein RbsC [Bellilinea sp.]
MMARIITQSLPSLLSNRVYFLFALLIIVLIIMSVISPYFLNTRTILDILRMGTVLLLLSLGQTLVILAGGAGIDLSVGAMLSLSGVFLGILSRSGVDIWVAALLTILFGGLLGSLNGFTVTIWGLPPLIGTLGSMWAYGALALVITNGIPISNFPREFAFIGDGRILGIPAQILLVALPVFVVLYFLLNWTYLGRWVYLIGVNETAAKFSGIPVTRVRFSLYTLNGLLAGIGAVVMASWLMAARPDVGNGMELQSITVTVLGGTNIFGGFGSLFGTLLSVLIVTLVASGLQLAGINAIWQLAVLGFILLGAVSINQLIYSLKAKQSGLSA